MIRLPRLQWSSPSKRRAILGALLALGVILHLLDGPPAPTAQSAVLASAAATPTASPPATQHSGAAALQQVVPSAGTAWPERSRWSEPERDPFALPRMATLTPTPSPFVPPPAPAAPPVAIPPPAMPAQAPVPNRPPLIYLGHLDDGGVRSAFVVVAGNTLQLKPGEAVPGSALPGQPASAAWVIKQIEPQQLTLTGPQQQEAVIAPGGPQ